MAKMGFVSMLKLFPLIKPRCSLLTPPIQHRALNKLFINLAAQQQAGGKDTSQTKPKPPIKKPQPPVPSGGKPPQHNDSTSSTKSFHTLIAYTKMTQPTKEVSTEAAAIYMPAS